jgi:amidase
VGLYLGVAKPEGLPDPLPADEVTGLLKQLSLDAGAAGLEAAGAEVVLVWGAAPDNMAEFFGVGNNGFRLGFADYMAATDPSYPIQTAADVVAFNEQDPATYAPYGQAPLVTAATSDMTREDYVALGTKLRTDARAWLDGVLADQDLDAIAAPNQALASAYAVAGYPAITVPMSPAVGLTFTGGYLSDGEMVGMAYAYEQATKVREGFAGAQ